MQLFNATFIKYGAKCKCDLKYILQNYFSTVLFSLICITKSCAMDYLRLNVIYDATVGLETRSSTTLAKYNSARTQLEVEV